MLNSTFILAKHYLFYLVNFEEFATRNASSSVLFLFASTLKNFENSPESFH